jgi:hypothetical protein
LFRVRLALSLPRASKVHEEEITVQVFNDEVADVPYDERVMKQQLKAWFRLLLSLPRKPGAGYRGKVTPLECVPLCIGLDQVGGYKLLDMREALDPDPSLVWHEWLKVYGAELTAAALSQERDDGVKISAGDLLSLATGEPGAAIAQLVSLLAGRRRR